MQNQFIGFTFIDSIYLGAKTILNESDKRVKMPRLLFKKLNKDKSASNSIIFNNNKFYVVLILLTKKSR